MQIFFNLRPFFIFLLLITIPILTKGQQSMPLSPIICYESGEIAKVRTALSGVNLRTQAISDFRVTYEGLPPEAVKAFEYAVGIWERSIPSSVPIAVKASWGPLASGSLASSGATSIFRDFDKKAIKNIWYPISLAEKITKRSLNSSLEFDITVTLNNNTNWYFGTDGNTPTTSIDFVSVVLHELAHGLGIISSAVVKDNQGTLKESNYPLVFDYYIEDSQKKRLTSLPSPSRDLYSQFTSNNLFFNSFNAGMIGQPLLKIYAPSFFDEGSSISHLDETLYPPGNPNSLMSPQFARGEAIHDPGELLIAMLMDIGWGISDDGSPISAKVFPIPSLNGNINLKFSQKVGRIHVKVIDGVGKQILKLRTDVNGMEGGIELGVLPIGIYFLLIETDLGEITKRIIIG